MPSDKRALAKSIFLGALQVLSVAGIIAGVFNKVRNNQFFFQQPYSSKHMTALNDIKDASRRTLLVR